MTIVLNTPYAAAVVKKREALEIARSSRVSGGQFVSNLNGFSGWTALSRARSRIL